MDSELENTVIKKLALEAFDMVLEGDLKDASSVFSAIETIKPGNRASAAGLAMIDMVEMRNSGRTNDIVFFRYEDLVVRCFQGLVLLDGFKEFSRALLGTVVEEGDSVSAKLAQVIIQTEIDNR